MKIKLTRELSSTGTRIYEGRTEDGWMVKVWIPRRIPNEKLKLEMDIEIDPYHAAKERLYQKGQI